MVAAGTALPGVRRDWLVVLAIFCMSLLLARCGPVQHLELTWLDASFRLLRQWRATPETAPVVIVGVDQTSIDASGKPFALMLDEFALALDGMRLGAARAAGVDLIFPATDFDQFTPGAGRRLALAIAGLRATAPLVLGNLGAVDQPAGSATGLYSAMAGTAGEGLLLVPVDRDGGLRRLGDGNMRSHLELLLAPRIAMRLGHQATAGIVDFSIGAPFTYIPLHTIVALANAGDIVRLRQLFAGKIVLLGAILPDQDRQRLPVRLAGWDDSASAPGVLFQAQAVRTLMQDRMIQSRPWLSDAAALLLVALLWMLRRRLGRASVVALTMAAVTLAGSILLLANATQAPVMAPLLAVTLMIGWLGTQAYLRELAEQRRIRAIFSGYVSPAILDTILSGALADGRAATCQPLAFLFADIRGFTAFCAAHPPEQVIAFLNRYYTVVTTALHRYGGTIDKFSGDGIMVFFGAPQPSANPARDAVLAGLAMLDALARLNLALASEGAAEVKVGIGIAYGDAVLGNVGSPARHDYTATGAATTLAAHIQQHCKCVPHALLVEHHAFELAQLPPRQRAMFCRMPVELDKHGHLLLAAYINHG